MKKIVAILMAMIMVMSVTVVLAGGAADNDTKTKEPVIIGFESTPGHADKAMVHGHGGDIKYSYTIINAIAAKLPEQAIENIQKNPRVTYVEMDVEVHTLEETLPWGVDRIDAELVWNGAEDGCDVTPGRNAGAGAIVAIIDTGLDKDHPDLAANIAGGRNFVGWSRVDPDAWDDDNGHGTHCGGIVAAVDNEEGVIGVAPEASLYGVKVLDRRGSGYVSDIIAGIEWAVENGADIISMSLGTTSDVPSLDGACDAAWNNGVLLVAAAGNEEGSPVIYPAAYSSVIAVSATNSDDNLASFSSTGPEVELAAPGVNIYSTYKKGGYAIKSGTSMACPHVAGTAALVIYSGIKDNDAVRGRLQNTAEDLGDLGFDTKYGHGLVDAEAAAGSAVTLESIAVTPETATIPKGLTQQYTATGTYSDASTADITSSVTWASTNTAVATIASAGLATGVGEGSTGITAALDSVGSDTAALTVTAPILQLITVMPNTATIEVDAEQQYMATGTYSDASTADITSSVTWASSNTAVATIASAGLATGVGDGSTDITATLGLISDTATLTVTVSILQSIAVMPDTATIEVAANQQYTAMGTYSDASTANITSSVTWASTNTAVATIDSVGLATGVGEGSTNITAALDSMVSNTATLTVTAPILQLITVTPDTATIEVDAKQQYTATGTYSDASTANITSSVTWASSATAVATIDSDGLATGVDDGSTNITAALDSVVSNTATLTVTAPSEPTAVIVESISYSTEGGRNQDKHLCIAVALVDNLENPVADASVSIDLYRDGAYYVSYTGTTGTDGTVTFKKNNAPSGIYTTTVTAVTAGELIWDEITPENNSFIKD